MKLDHIDFNILRELQEDGRLSNQELASRVGLSPSPCWRRVRKMEEEGILKQYVALLDPDKIGLPILAYCQVMLEKHQLDQSDQFDEMIRERAEVLEYYSMSGDYDYLIKVISPSIREYEEFQTQFLMRLPVVRSVSTSFVLRQKKHTTRLPLRFVEE